MKSLSLILGLAVFGLVASVLAAPRMPTIDDQIKELTEKLELSEDQVATVTTIFEESALPELFDQMAEQDGDRESRREIMQSLREEMKKVNESIREILTDDQKETFDEFLKERRESRPSGREGRGGGRKSGR